MDDITKTRQRICEKATDMFFDTGHTRITMDEIAHELCMSKKTLYKHFHSKSELLHEIAMNFINDVIIEQNKILDDKNIDFIERFGKLMRLITQIVEQIKPALIRDIQRSAPKVWKIIESVRHQRIQIIFNQLMVEGQANGLFRKDLNKHILVSLLAEMIRGTFTSDALSTQLFSRNETFGAVRTVFLEGILTERGRNMLRK